MASEIDACAKWIVERRLAGRTLADMPKALKPLDESQGYAVQKAVEALLGEEDWGRRIGWKIGATTPAMRKHLSIDHAMFGSMLERSRHANGAKIDSDAFVRTGIECEIAMVMARPLSGKVTPEQAAEAVGEIHPAIELVDDRYGGDYPRMGVPAIAADFVFHAGLVLGAPVANWRRIDLLEVIGITRANGVEQCRGKGADVMGNPMASLAWLAGALGEHGERLEPGQIVMTGSLPIPYWAKPKEKIEIELSGLGKVAIELS